MTNNKKEKLILLDSHAILHRAYHALPDFATSKGEPTGALYGVSSMLIKIISDLKPDYIVACFDLPEKTYRHEAYEDYKSGRSKTDDELVEQIKRSYDIFKALNIPIYSAPGFEADDILGTIAKETKKDKNLEVIIASGDMDTLQLVDNKRVQVFTLRKGIKDTVTYDEKAVNDRYGFGPDLIADYKGLRGDPSDNIIGIKGVGEKTATTLLTTFGSIENIYKELKKDKQKVIDSGITERLANLLLEGEEEAEFSKMLATIRTDAPIKWELPKEKWTKTISIEKALDLFQELEFRGLGDRLRDALGTQNKIDFKNAEKDNPKDKLEKLRSEEKDIKKEDLKKAKIGVWILDSNITNPQLDDIYTFTKTKDFKNAFTIIKNEIKKRNLTFVYEKIELPLVPVVEKMHERGVLIDKKSLKKLSEKYHLELEKLEKKIWEAAGKEFNINSPKQLGEIIYDVLELKPARIKKTAGGQKSTAEKELLKMKNMHPIIKDILSYRELQKLLSTYIDNIPEMLDSDSRLRAKFIQTGTTTGRMSSQDPNLQNIPIKTDLGRHIRNSFVAEDGFRLIAIDYSQVELRIAAFLSEDKKLIDTFKNNEDIHNRVASEIFEVKSNEVTKNQRSKAKVINFGILYGMGVNALRQNLGEDTTRKEAQDFYEKYFEKFEGLTEYMEKIKAEVERKGYTETVFGRRRYFEGFKSKIPYIRAQAERMAINAPIQGTQADLIKLAMARIDEYIEKELKGDAYTILQIHDELIFEVREKEVDNFTKKAKEIMETILDKKITKGVPVIANVEVGDNWGEMEKYESKDKK